MGFENLSSNGVADNDKSFALINRGYDAGRYEAGQWFETVADVYHHFLGALPPLEFDGKDFVMAEQSTSRLSDAFLKIGNRFFCLTVEHRLDGIADAFSNFRTHILEGAVE